MNLPNKLTMFRLILVPFFVAVLLAPALPHHYLIAAILFAVASYTDHLDGMLARKNNQITDFGKFMDPLADKVLVISALVCFVELHLANVWLVLLIIAREFMVTSIRLVAADKGQVIAANNWGKAKTVSQIIAILVVLFLQYWLELAVAGVALPVTVNEPLASLFGQLLILIATALAVISGLIYLKQNWQIVKTAG
ncbi:CDP-diacylglycerol--glycerol-3-phosphate 3-phosphatidyltransferase [Clostridium sp. MSTE9]|uniref:CDP-diacylglycerol--glycerol-3-phosphate 3-phosphatidyltransferase n=1 Tax=Clostridium sp. (strain MSTE9) TaxID=1105031 RepID=UPI00026F20B0|nr:CDP-diacylglycerol--glycerol-3-phosphate 3-phosphatidyltransferase [Clostridium sp. MSTE9]EJF41847.1 CDP-diacylglycerol--glycerol-3-phosphate 3-phosphatidyltransferase [Clostridium sp. MSTE9]